MRGGAIVVDAGLLADGPMLEPREMSYVGTHRGEAEATDAQAGTFGGPRFPESEPARGHAVRVGGTN